MDVDTIMVLAAAQRTPVQFSTEVGTFDGVLVGWPRHRHVAVIVRNNRHLRVPKDAVRLPIGGAS